MATTKSTQRYYPNEKDFPSFSTFDAHRQTLDQQYALEDRVKALEGAGKGAPSAGGAPSTSTSSPNAVSTIAGIPVNGSPTADKQTLKWNATTGQIEWG